MQIRCASESDYDGMYGLWMNTKGMGMRSLDDSREGITRFLRRNPSTCFVAEEGDCIIGAILCGNDGRRGYIYHTAVAETYRKQGIAKALVGAVLEALKSEGIYKAALVCFKTNELGNAFWEGTGWELREDLNYYNRKLTDAEN